jgi:hypothetical protein
MTNLFTAYGAARLLERDRQTIERATRHLKPDGQKGKSPLWRLSRIVERLNGTHNDSASTSAPMHLVVLYAKLDQLYDRVTDAQSVAEARRIMRSEFFPTLAETTAAMIEEIRDDDIRILAVMEHERVQLAVYRRSCDWTMEELLAEYNKATWRAELDDIDGVKLA